MARVVWEVLERIAVEEKSQAQQSKEASIIKRKLAECAGAAAVRCPADSDVGVKGVVVKIQQWVLGAESHGAATAVLVATAMAEVERIIRSHRFVFKIIEREREGVCVCVCGRSWTKL